VSKLVAWGADRTQAIARMRRALAEYEVGGIRTSVEFFRWMLRQPAFVGAQIHTEYLDELLHSRRGEPFSERDPSLEEVAIIAAAIRAASSSARDVAVEAGAASRPGGWLRTARTEALREPYPAPAAWGRRA
jgi:acetyl-CoA carboxylase biotin carboxylase subunit